MDNKFTPLSKLFLPLFAIYIFVFAACESPECKVDADCSDAVCTSEGTCVACNETSDCGADSFCCQNTCYTADKLEDHCGCSANGTEEGTKCGGEKNICTVEKTVGDKKISKRASIKNVADGICSCACSPLEGGTLCAVDDSNDLGYKCECSRSDDEKTCGSVIKDGNNQLHIPADTCTPENSCVCLSEEATCGTGGLAPDCSKSKCVDLNDDENNCGVSDQQCGMLGEGNATTAALCISGGCQCDSPSDCQGDKLNVDMCTLVTAGANQCVCDNYKDNGTAAACPLGLECKDEGCMYGTVAVKTRKALLVLLGQSPDAAQ